ncbi:MAG: IS21 family transposase [Alphaproteobacteria bacterium]|nr:IS21 family transposase [Alphaproteobacteria bacterium]
MARRKIEMLEVREVIYQWQKGQGSRIISRSLGIARTTIRDLLKKAKFLGLKIDSKGEETERIIERLIKERYVREEPGPAQRHLSTHHKKIEEWRLSPHMTTKQMVRLFKEEGEKISEGSLRRYLKKHFAELVRTTSTVHLEIEAGQQAQVDFGYVGFMKDPLSGKMRKAWAFIMTLAYSRYRFVRFVFKQDIKTWVDCHIRAFNFFGAIPKSVLLDNLKSGILKPDIYDPTLNRTYGELERHYGFIADPAKVRIAQHKGRVERSVAICRQQILAGRVFKDIEEANVYALKWCRHENAHAVTRTTGKTPWKMFEVEKEHMLSLPTEEFECPIWQRALVHKDQHIIFEGSFYSVPHAYVRETVWIRATLRLVEIFFEQTRIKSHIRENRKGQWITDQKDYPKGARYFLEKGIPECLEEAKEIGDSVHAFLSQFLVKPSMTHQRKAQAILRLSETYSPVRLEAACKRALLFESTTYRSLKRILEDGLDYKPLTEERSNRLSPEQLKEGCYLRRASEFSAAQEEACL